MHPTTPHAEAPPLDAAAILNRDCRCLGVDPIRLERALGEGLGDPALAAALRETHRNLFAPQPVFLGKSHFEAMRRVVTAITEVAGKQGYLEEVAARTPDLVESG